MVGSVHTYSVRSGNTKNITDHVRETETKALRGQWVAETAFELKQQGYTPDLIIAHPGWGESMFLSDVWSACPQLHYLEFDYGSKTDCGFDPEFDSEQSLHQLMQYRMKNAAALISFQAMTWGYTPTPFQWRTLPAAYRQRVSVIHDGIDCQTLRPNSQASLELPNGVRLRLGDPVLTFVNRTFEPYRGIHCLMRALPELQRCWPSLQVLLIGSDSSKLSYGKNRNDGRGWLAALRDELGDQLDWSRIHVPGPLRYESFIVAMQISAVHVYYTYPFVLSWSLLEAMACGAMVVASATEPVLDVIEDGVNGLLVGFHDRQALINAISRVLNDPHKFQEMRRNARRTIKNRFMLQDCIKRQLALVDALALGSI